MYIYYPKVSGQAKYLCFFSCPETSIKYIIINPDFIDKQNIYGFLLLNILNTFNNRMRLLETDLYIDCYDLIQEANKLYEITKEKELYKDDIYYIESMNKYINSYDKFKEKQIKQYITDLKDYNIYI